jgi:hypothetical protein
MLEIGEDFVTISDEFGEIVHWVEDEWIEDSSVVISIAVAIRMYYEQGTDAIRSTVGK